MMCCKGISIPLLGVLLLLVCSKIQAANDWSHTQIRGGAEGYYSDRFSDSGTSMSDSDADAVIFSIVDGQATQDSPEDVPYYLIYRDYLGRDEGVNTLFSAGVGGNDFDAPLKTGGLIAGSYELVFDRSGGGGGVHNVAFSAVPLPSAAWLFGTALVGFVAFSVRRSV